LVDKPGIGDQQGRFVDANPLATGKLFGANMIFVNQFHLRAVAVA
jgi:hypothetical protein